MILRLTIGNENGNGHITAGEDNEWRTTNTSAVIFIRHSSLVIFILNIVARLFFIGVTHAAVLPHCA